MGKKFFIVFMIAVTVISAVSCREGISESENSPVVSYESEEQVYTDPFADLYGDELSNAIYNEALGEFLKAYEAAQAKTDNLSEKIALTAIAEAKLMESGVVLPLTSEGGNYAVSRLAPNTVPSVLWGSDSDRYGSALVTAEFITASDRAEMKAEYNELKGSGRYLEWAKSFLLNKGYTLKDTYTVAYYSDPGIWDSVAASSAADLEAVVNTYEGLYEYDVEGNLKPALAESFTVASFGEGDDLRTVYTFKIRKGQIWVDRRGKKAADLTANDFVTGMQHALDAAGGLEYLVCGVIVNAEEYLNGEITDFSKVGVRAVDDYTLEYTLIGNPTYFMSMLSSNIFAPVNKEFYVEKGGKFGSGFDAEDESYSYGKTPDDIAYCGPYLVEDMIAGTAVRFVPNKSYRNSDKANIKTILWLFIDSDDPAELYEAAKAGTIDGAGLYGSALELAKTENYFEKYAYITYNGAASYVAVYNLNRRILHNFSDETTAVSPMSEEDSKRTNAALRNASFRRAISFALDRGAYNAPSQGEATKLNSLRNSLTPGSFVRLDEEATVLINGVEKTYPAGTAYGRIMQDQIDADGVKIKVWDPEADEGVGSSDGFDGWYSKENAVAELNRAVSELAAVGLEISAENPIQLDLPYTSASDALSERAKIYKTSLETVLEGKVKVNLVECPTFEDWYAAAYYPAVGGRMNYTVNDLSVCLPDYGDPKTYLDAFLPDHAGYMTKCLGIF